MLLSQRQRQAEPVRQSRRQTRRLSLLCMQRSRELRGLRDGLHVVADVQGRDAVPRMGTAGGERAAP